MGRDVPLLFSAANGAVAVQSAGCWLLASASRGRSRFLAAGEVVGSALCNGDVWSRFIFFFIFAFPVPVSSACKGRPCEFVANDNDNDNDYYLDLEGCQGGLRICAMDEQTQSCAWLDGNRYVYSVLRRMSGSGCCLRIGRDALASDT